MQLLYDSALRTLVLHSVDKVYPGPYTYKRFWYRDATFIVYALLCTGLSQRAEKALDYFPTQQTYSGYFHSQEGEWDSNGQALWIFSQFSQFTHEKTKPAWQSSIDQGVRWLIKKRLPDLPESPHSGLLPAGFSAEHLGPNDYYYWDDFWSLAGLQAIYKGVKDQAKAVKSDLRLEIEHTQSAIEKSLTAASQRLGLDALPASPYRRLDSGAIGSLVASYPLQLCEPQDLRLMNTVEFLLKNCCFQGCFFQDMIHSGINPYLTLHIAQVLLRAGDSRFFTLMTTVADLASSTGQWPEAIHPHTGGGCMGDGQHAWAAAEWLVMMRNCFVREEDDHLILASGITAVWWQTGQCLSFGVAPTQFGSVSVSIQYKEQYEKSTQQVNKYIVVSWQGDWHDQAPRISVNLPGFTSVIADAKQTQIIINAETFL